MGKLATEIERAEAAGAKRVTGFEGAVRSLEDVSFRKGDEFTFPTSFEIYERKFGNNKAQFIFVTVNGDDNNIKAFYPSTFTKSRAVYNEDKTLTGKRAHTMGTAAEEFRKYGTVTAAMDAMKGKKVKVTDEVTVRTLRYGTTELMDAQILTIDFVE